MQHSAAVNYSQAMAKKPVILMGGGFTGGGKSPECEAKVMAKYGGE